MSELSEVIELGCELRHRLPERPQVRARPRHRGPASTPRDPAQVRNSLKEYIRNFEAKIAELLREQRFRRLAATWKAETKFLSNVGTKVLHPAYQGIIGMGNDAVPYILNDLAKNGPADWFWALYSITQANPVTEGIAGNMSAMTEAWLRWGEKEGYLKVGSRRKTKRASRA